MPPAGLFTKKRRESPGLGIVSLSTTLMTRLGFSPAKYCAAERASASVMALIDAIINCAASGDPLAHLLLGCEKDVLTEMRTVAKHQFMGASRLGSISLVKLRFPGAATWRMLREGGFAKEDVLRELQREPGFNGIY